MRSLEFDEAAFEDLAWWIKQDRSKALRIVDLIKNVQRDPFKGIGKPESLRHQLKGVGPEESIKNIDLSIKLLKRRSESSRASTTIEVFCR